MSEKQTLLGLRVVETAGLPSEGFAVVSPQVDLRGFAKAIIWDGEEFTEVDLQVPETEVRP